MHVYDLDCGWIKVTQKNQIDKIKKSGVKESHIDTDKGIDVGEEPTVENENIETVDGPESLPPDVRSVAQKQSLTCELLNATKVKKEAIQVVSKIMEDARLGKLIDLDHIEPVVENIVFSALNNKDALLGLMRIRKLDRYTFEHSVGSSILLVAFGESLALDDDELMQVGMGGLLMDIGKSVMPPSILAKPGKLSDAESAIMRKHVAHSEDILGKIPNISDIVMKIAAEHHERTDGSGYPLGKAGEDISLYGQMAAIVDVYDALTVPRVYSKERSPNSALKKLVSNTGGFNQELVQQFIHCVGIYPIGSLVALSNGAFAVVIESGDKGLLYPIIRVIFDSTKRQFITPQDIDLSDQREQEIVRIVGAVEPAKWRIKPTDFMEHAKYG